ncbi:hypothetical protein [Paraburkholderia sartisoli]|uniref:Uncharacterized protein n=1 Tax=Paraburkholderia sartisoli TaxID=83784 RepID=A0A1H4HBZ5_9BURK|nr:hypothetical protein [Paraburkholderia sartisoli]SEB19337.1 hypothetical protein SAMN05192564_10856 [Paraburkholderia sartisoli]
MLALKLTLVPFFLLGVSMSGKWWGPSIAGWLAGLPVVAGPILYLLVLAHGPEFGARAATLSLSAILASEAFNFAYAWICRSRSWPIALAAALGTWFVAACLLSLLPVSLVWAVCVALTAVLFGQSFLPRSAAVAAGAPLGRADLAGRMLAGAVLTLVVTAVSARVGATWSGLLAVFPLLTSVLSVSSHRAHGPAFVVSLLRGMVLGRFSFAAFCLFLSLVLPYQAATPSFIEAAALAMFVQWCTRRLTVTAGARAQANSAAGME